MSADMAQTVVTVVASVIGTVVSAGIIAGATVGVRWLLRRRRRRWLLFRQPGGTWGLQWHGPGVATHVSWLSFREYDMLAYIPIPMDFRSGGTYSLENGVRQDARFLIQWNDTARRFGEVIVTGEGDRFFVKAVSN